MTRIDANSAQANSRFSVLIFCHFSFTSLLYFRLPIQNDLIIKCRWSAGFELCSLIIAVHVMFVSPQKHTVTREGHEVRERLSIGEHQ